ncbi:hypothetical protein [Massilia aquatica]|uniref:Uncharacterized protein n=1 Tax=Massilia aquatica TaxID=2609000 RepID=A0ABX0MB20_9BURK|nr:hypothetical protein [Massilia aquatica]NHZ42138.1 hypothetical protein [Massilia aquatica]
MKIDKKLQDQELRHKIDEQEQAMSALLTRVLERPLTPLHKAIEELRAQIAAVEQASVHAAQTAEAGLSELMEGQGKRLKSQVNDVLDDVEGLKGALAGLSAALETRHGELLGHDERMHDRLARQQAHFDDGLGKAAATLDTLDHKVASAADGIAVAARMAAKVDADLGLLRQQEQAHAGELNGGLDALVQQLNRHHAGLAQRIETVTPALVPLFDALGASVDKSSREIVQGHDTLAQAQQALLTSTVQQQLALQLAPFQARTTWLAVMCALSCASTLVLLGMQLIH